MTYVWATLCAGKTDEPSQIDIRVVIALEDSLDTRLLDGVTNKPKYFLGSVVVVVGGSDVKFVASSLITTRLARSGANNKNNINVRVIAQRRKPCAANLSTLDAHHRAHDANEERLVTPLRALPASIHGWDRQ